MKYIIFCEVRVFSCQLISLKARIEKELYHLPGYMGHQPQHNPPSTTTYRRRNSEKEKMLLYDLDQYSRELWPHYKGHKAQVFTFDLNPSHKHDYKFLYNFSCRILVYNIMESPFQISLKWKTMCNKSFMIHKLHLPMESR